MGARTVKNQSASKEKEAGEAQKVVVNRRGRPVKRPIEQQQKPAKKAKRPAAEQKKPVKRVKEEEFEVESVKGVQVKDKATLYFIKWKGYSESKNTWEPSENVYSTNLVRKFLEDAMSNVKSDRESEDEEEIA